MNSSGVLRWLLLIVPLLLLSVAWKIAVAIATPIQMNATEANNTIIDFLERRNFVVTEEIIKGFSVLKAKTETCQLEATSVASEASSRDEARYLFKGMDVYFVVLDGRVYTQQPILSSALHEIWSASLGKLGLKSHVPPVIAVGASKSCDAEQLPWDELR